GLPLLYIGLPMLASLSVTHGFLPPHPAPTAIANNYDADLGLTLIYGIIAGIPAILSAKYALQKVMVSIQPELNQEFITENDDEYLITLLFICHIVDFLTFIIIVCYFFFYSFIHIYLIVYN